jgi:mRNA-degrading endonuclease RelE of RelBE toxin-antitoxin system
MLLQTSNTFLKDLEKLSSPDKERVVKALKIFAENPRHPGLHTEKLTNNIWSARASDKIRFTFEWDGDITRVSPDDHVFLRKVGYHEKIYRSP